MSSGERYHDALCYVGYSLIPWRKRNDAERTMMQQAASVYDRATAAHVSAIEAEVVTLREQNVALRLSESRALADNTELRASRADLAGKLLEHGKTIDELRATVAGYVQANHNQSVLVQELRDRITKLETGGNNAIELICDMLPYVEQWAREKYKHTEWLTRVAAVFGVDVASALTTLNEEDKQR